MPYAYDVVRVTISGTAYGGTEIWSTGFYMGGESGDASDPTQAWADDIRAAWQTFFTATGSGAFASSHTTTAVKLSKLDNVTGKAIPDKTVWANLQTPFSGATGVFQPPQTALVATLLSAAPRGLAAKGRMYLPPPATSTLSTGRLSTATRDAIRTNLVAFFDTIHGDVDVPAQVILASQGREAPAIGAPVNRFVTTVRVGDVWDTQRRRRNQLVESYASGTLA